VCRSFVVCSVAVSVGCFHAELCISGQVDVYRGGVVDLGPNPLQHQVVDL